MESQIRYWIQAVLTTCAKIEMCSLNMQHARANNTTNRVVGKGSVRFRMSNGRRNSESFPRETSRCCGKRRLEGYTDCRGVSSQGELLSDMGPVVLARRVDKGSNRCTKVRKASAGVLGGSVMVPGGSGAVQERYKSTGRCFGICREVWSDTSGATSAGCPKREVQRKETKSILRNCYSEGRGRRDEATTTRKVMYFAAHPDGGCKYTPMGECKVPRSYGRAGSEAVKMDNLKISDYPPVGWRGRLLSPAQLNEFKPTHLDKSKSSSQAQARLALTWSVHVKL
ncbi:hypothetical protein Acr_11g0004030 [Actinidia rufa]|uniref:Uncharacterized protein n=1 Tax=Actinidia rufa TaxID=165716 RepID=A0A7J0FDU4_9ERIC|nr:hypothetical protein Acr_11g0004030 [Actinidia rufa]